MTFVPTHRESVDPAPQTADWGPLSGLPGNPMIWILILGEMAVFGALLLGFSVARVLDPATFAESQLHLHRLLGGVNTLVLVSSGFLVAAGVSRRQERRDPRLLLVAGMLLGVAFLAIKGVEYRELFASGFDIETNTFFQLYFLITGFHAVHIVLGLAILGIVLFADSIENLETGAAFWHMLDMIWVMIYPIIYLVR
ncbi:MAG: cytochrome c oxidase subunit 3 family protein [Rhizobiales bacterium]|nr:cytochrome c oxidase subunit 3 family protein [Hyphomicrobiales bacterium]